MTQSTSSFIALIDSSPFWSSFFSQLFATSVVVLIGSILIPSTYWFTRRAKLRLYRTGGSILSNKFFFTESQDKQWEITLDLSIANDSRRTMERFYWEIYHDKNVKIDFDHVGMYKSGIKFNRVEGKNSIRYFGFIQTPIFPYDDVNFPLVIKIKQKERRLVKLYYYFRTDNGNSPLRSRPVLMIRKYQWLRSLCIQ